MTRSRNKKPARLLRSLYIWHRYLGLTASLFVFLLAVTGLALNHTEELRLDSTYIGSNTLLDWYGIEAPGIGRSFPAGAYRFTRVGTRLYRDAALVHDQATPLAGAVAGDGLLIVGLEDRLLLFTPEGELIEKLDAAAGVPPGLQALGVDGDGRLAVRTAGGNYTVDADFLDWQKMHDLDAAWVMEEKPPAALVQSIEADWRGAGLPVERVLLDLHSGRIFGSRGVYLMDAAAILFIVLAGTGIWLWGKRRASARRHERAKQQHPSN